MTRDEFHAAESLLTEALFVSAEEQQAMLDSAGVGEDIRRELLQLLRRTSSVLPRLAGNEAPIAPSSPLLAAGDAVQDGRFAVIRQLGRGGMGEVHLAHDTRLGTLVALKVLFEPHTREAQHARLCSGHPHVATMHDVFETAIGDRVVTVLVIEYVPGKPASRLIDDGPVDVRDAVRWTRQIASAIAHAHDRGVLHCDLKPANIIITADEGAKVLDFGIGRAAFERDRPGEPLRGTAAYMAPEQLLDRQFSEAGDIYGLGVTLFELLTGRLPFDAAVPALLLQVAGEPAPRVSQWRGDVPPALDDIVARALAKDPGERYRSARALERALAALDVDASTATIAVPVAPAAALASPRPGRGRLYASVAAVVAAAAVVGAAVLGNFDAVPTDAAGVRAITVAPFELAAGAGDDGQAVAVAIAADLAAELQGAELVVKGRTAPMGRDAGDVVTLAARMGADAVVRASMTLADDRLSIDVGLVQTRTRRELWREVYEATAAQAGSLPRSIAADIERALGRPRPVARRAGTVGLPAYDHYARGRQLAEERSADALTRAAAQFEEAIRIEPAFASAWAALADVYIALGVPAFGPLRPADARGRAQAAALKALDLDSQLAEAHTSLAFLSFFHDWNWTAADERFRRALALNAGYATAHHWYADFLNTQGRFTEASEHIQMAVALEPLSLLFRRDVAWHQFFQGRYADAAAQLRGLLAEAPRYAPARSLLGRALVQQGAFAEGIAELRALDQSNPANQAMLAHAYAAAGDRAAAARALAALRRRGESTYVSPYALALVETALGERTQAIASLRRAYAEQDSTIVNVNVDPRLAVLRGDRGFQDVVRQMHFPDRPGGDR